MSKSDGQNKALAIAKSKLLETDLHERLRSLRFNGFQNNRIQFKLFDNLVTFDEKNLRLLKLDADDKLRIDDSILFFHYLLSDAPVNQSDQYISFRELPGGQFYWDPFMARSVVPLVKRIGNDLSLLKKNLARFDWEPQKYGDFGAKIHVIGDIYVLLTYQLGDDEFPPTANISFPESIKHIYSTEDVAVIASRICLGLL